MATDPQNATLVQRQTLHDNLAIYRIAYKDHEVPDFTPGQFTNLGLQAPPDQQPPDGAQRRPGRGPKLVRRAYSIASPPSQKDYLEFYVVEVNDGKLTSRLFDLDPGDSLFMDPKIKGKFTLDPVPPGKDLVMIATGTGLAPFRSMYYAYRNTDRWRKFVVIHGARVQADLGYRDEFERLAAEDPTFRYIPLCTREPDTSNWSGLKGRVHVALEPETYAELTGDPMSPDQTRFFLCGNPAMIDECETRLTDRGYSVYHRANNPEGQIHFERYW